jgi:hypothetical protein
MFHALERVECTVDEVVARRALQVGEKAHAAGVVLETGVVEAALRPLRRLLVVHRKPRELAHGAAGDSRPNMSEACT